MSEITEILFNISLFVLCMLIAVACTGIAIAIATAIHELTTNDV
jgi:hypothetical protein